ncbi:UNVERIFIED_ORG: HemY protein [Rhizobium sp. SORGH_AS260]|jgi:HemY protein|uniref:heme biosynthesis protein HemY n=1 Tax=Agrobacterium sp. SORGH_AS_0440 TaxID=3041757 RepID=UPI00277FFBDF|nr:heme biosynthesis protein HemY [Agrobacterium sp. SORGH_AS_0440]MDP9734276.1 HemY protein [Rhizobium sp. SORGH_AS_0285]MDP9756595.1 HemY protein [Rhizobium sp. SORGH_AS_0260]MDR6083460.1 HemY protein [Agrobacterium sp. SORGH_AS_0440]
MTRILTFAVIVLALGFGFSWLADRPGVLSIVWQGRLIEMSLMVAASIIAALIAAAMLLWWIVNAVWTSPNAARRYFRARKRDRGYQALSTGLIAAGAGNAILARKMTARTQGLLSADQEPLIHLLDAQADLIEGKYDEARRKFEAMARDPETRELGLRGLYIEARRQGAYEAAQQYAEDAAEKAPYLPWAAQATLENRCRNGQWDDAIRLLDQQKAASVIERGEAERLKAVLLTAKAGEKLESDPVGAREDAKHALKLAKGLVPAALIAAKSYLREDNLRKAAAILEPVWKNDPHPQIAELYVRARSGDTAIDRLKRAERLESLKPNNIESLFAVAQAALDAKEFAKARAKAEAAARIEPRESIFLLMADIEEAETGDQGRVRYWMAQALRAPRDPAWVADGIVSEKWLPVSPVTGRLDAFEWKAPFGQLEGPVEDLTIENAIAAAPARTEPTVKTVVVETAPETRAEPKRASAEPIEVKPSVSAPTEKKPVTIEAPVETEAANEKAEAVPFFGGAPDDPGVKKPGAEAEPKTRLKLF